MGKFAAVNSGASTCIDCGAGYYSTEIGAHSRSDCQECIVGSWSSKVGAHTSDSCVKCISGKWSSTKAGSNITVCINCGAGKWSSTIGATSSKTCQACPAKKVSNVTGASLSNTCQACPENGNVPNKKQTKCEAKDIVHVNNPIPAICVSVAAGVGLVGLAAYCLRKINRNKAEHSFEMTEQNEHTQRLLDSANNPLEQTQFLIDPSELHLGE